MKESTVEAAIRDYAKSLHCLTFKFTSPATPGVPDRIVISPEGKVLFLEVKRPGERPRKLQAHWLLQLRAMGVRAEWADTVECGKLAIDKLLHE